MCYSAGLKVSVFSALILSFSVLAPILPGQGMVSPAVAAEEYTVGKIVVSSPWARAMAPAAKVGAGYVTFSNHGDMADRLVAIQSDVAERVEIHEMQMENGVMKMRRVIGGLEIVPHGSVVLQPGGYHLMFVHPHKPFMAGERFKASFEFARAGKVDVTFAVRDDKSGKGGRAP